MMKKPLISIVIPVYNNKTFLPFAVQSVLSQDSDDYEVIIVDDGSTDGSGELADKLAEENLCIRVIHQENRWIYASMNRGVQEASGDYVYILNSDDRLHDGVLSIFAYYICKYKPCIIWTKIEEYQYISQQNDIYELVRSDEIHIKDFYINDLNEIKTIWPTLYFSHLAGNQANLYKRKLIIDHPFHEDMFGADVILNIELADDVKSMVIMREPVYKFFRYNSASLNASVGKWYENEHVVYNAIYEGYEKLFSKWNLPSSMYHDRLANGRICNITREIRSYGFPNCTLKIEEKVKRILSIIPDSVVFKCAISLDREREVHTRIISGLCELLGNENLDDNSEVIFVYDLIDLLYHKDHSDSYLRVWEKSVYHPLNPNNIGKPLLEEYNKYG